MYSKSTLFEPPPRRGLTWKITFSLAQALNPFSEEDSQKIIEEVTNFIVNIVSLYPPLVRIPFILGLLLFDMHSIFFRFRRTSHLKPEKIQTIFKKWLNATGIKRNFARAFLAILNSSFFEHPLYMKTIGYPWV